MSTKIQAALQMLREEANNMSREAFKEAVREVVEDGNFRYALLDAGAIAVEEHQKAVANLRGFRTEHEKEGPKPL